MAKSAVDDAVEKLKSQIADLERAIDALESVRSADAPAEKPGKRRGRKPKGLPAQTITEDV